MKNKLISTVILGEKTIFKVLKDEKLVKEKLGSCSKVDEYFSILAFLEGEKYIEIVSPEVVLVLDRQNRYNLEV